jgi:hypothetical protein
LREALEQASNLPLSEIMAAMIENSNLPASDSVAEEDQSPRGSQQESADQANEQNSSNQNSSQDQDQKKVQPGTGAPGQRKSNGLGTGFVPKTPELTAEMMAGSTAQRATRKLLGRQASISPQLAKDQSTSRDQPTDLEEGQPSDSENANSSGLTKKDGAAAVNQKVKNGQVDKQGEGTEAAGMTASKSREKEEKIPTRNSQEEAWFARLPPELRRSIRAGGGQKPPRGYEQQLKKYFQSID